MDYYYVLHTTKRQTILLVTLRTIVHTYIQEECEQTSSCEGEEGEEEDSVLYQKKSPERRKMLFEEKRHCCARSGKKIIQITVKEGPRKARERLQRDQSRGRRGQEVQHGPAGTKKSNGKSEQEKTKQKRKHHRHASTINTFKFQHHHHVQNTLASKFHR